MMCLGKIWDAQTSEYGDHRPLDGAKPPNIPIEFHQFTEKAIRDSPVLIEQDSETRNPEKILPWMSPNTCLVNFYSQNGRLGLHQDKDESEESLRCQWCPSPLDVVLESGDVLIFGERSRYIFHGITVIHPNTAPKLLLEETNLRPVLLNLA